MSETTPFGNAAVALATVAALGLSSLGLRCGEPRQPERRYGGKGDSAPGPQVIS